MATGELFEVGLAIDGLSPSKDTGIVVEGNIFDAILGDKAWLERPINERLDPNLAGVFNDVRDWAELMVDDLEREERRPIWARFPYIGGDLSNGRPWKNA